MPGAGGGVQKVIVGGDQNGKAGDNKTEDASEGLVAAELGLS